MSPKYSERINKLPPYLFLEIDRKKKEAIKRGVKIIDFGVGDPDLPTPEYIRKRMKAAVDDPQNHRYPFGEGLLEFRKSVSTWYLHRFGVELDPVSEVHSLIGSKEGIGHLPLAFVNPNDVVLCPEPGYPVYRGSTIIAGGEPVNMPLVERNRFLPDLGAIPESAARKAVLMFINYPNNPTGACADIMFYEDVVEFAKKYGIIIAHDAAYSELYFSDSKPVSFLQVKGAKEVGIEFHSLSKTYSMTGWRIGWVCGNPDIIKGLSIIKGNVDSGAFNAVQVSAVEALDGPAKHCDEIRAVFNSRMEMMTQGLKCLGWDVSKPPATFYLWVRTPRGCSSVECAGKLLEEAGIIASPGNGFGPSGEGYVRFSLTVKEELIEEALQRLKKIEW
jgi:LL-diaminopimelate aminotransferase